MALLGLTSALLCLSMQSNSYTTADLDQLCKQVADKAVAEFKLKPEQVEVTLASLDRAHGTSVVGSCRGDTEMYPASVVKLFYLAYAGHLLETGKLKMTDELQRAVHDMIVDSVNDATGLVLETMRYEDEVRKAQSYFKDIPATKPDKGLLDLATTLIEQRSAPFDAGEFHDRYVDALKKLIEKKRKSKGKKILEDVEEPERTGGSNVIDLMAALKKSVGSEKKPAAKKSAPKKAASRAGARKRA